MGRLNDGHPTSLTFSAAPSGFSLVMQEKSVTPPGIDGGGENDTTTMRNSVFRTKQPKVLKTLSEGSATVAYDTELYEDALAMINVNQQITVSFPDTSTYQFWGWLNSFIPGEIVEGTQPTAEINIVPSNQDNAGVEQAPVRSAP